MYNPNSEVYLLNTPLVKNDENTFVFDSKEEQFEFFQNYARKYSSWYSTSCTFVRDGVIRVGKNIEQLYRYNYLMYKNSQYTAKWFYCFIDELVYVNARTTEIHFSTDVLQTWYFDWYVRSGFIERQTPLEDNYSTVADTPATGTLTLLESKSFNFVGSYFVFCTNDITTDDCSTSEAKTFTCGRATLPYLVIKFNADINGSDELCTFMQNVSNKGRGDRVLSVVYMPFVDDDTYTFETEEISESDVGQFTIVKTATPNFKNLTLEYEPQELLKLPFKKMQTKPYSEIRLTDLTTGQYIQLDFSKFNLNTDDNKMKFIVYPTISPTPSYRIMPMNYCNQRIAFDQALVINCNTSLPTINNQYASYMMKNGAINDLNKQFAKGELSLANSRLGIQYKQNQIGNLVNGVASLLNKNIVGAGQSLVSAYFANQNYHQGLQEAQYSSYEKIASITAQEDSASKMASQMTGVTDGAIERLVFQNGILISVFSLDKYFKRNVTNFWKLYGYPVNDMGKINFKVDYQRWCYCKMAYINIDGNGIPQNELQEIRRLYLQGITWWKADNRFKLYD